MRTTCPFVEKFFVDVETHYLPDAGTQVCSINSGGGKATPNIYGTPSFYNYCKETTVDITSKSPGEENVGGGGGECSRLGIPVLLNNCGWSLLYMYML